MDEEQEAKVKYAEQFNRRVEETAHKMFLELEQAFINDMARGIAIQEMDKRFGDSWKPKK